MQVTRLLIFEGTREQLIHQLRFSAPDGEWKLEGGLRIKVVTASTLEDIQLLKAIDHRPKQWPEELQTKGGDVEMGDE